MAGRRPVRDVPAARDPLIGSGLARIVELDRTRLLLMIVESFADHCRRDPATAPELRVVIRPADLERTDLSVLGTYLRTRRLPGTNTTAGTGTSADVGAGTGSQDTGAGAGDSGGAYGRR